MTGERQTACALLTVSNLALKPFAVVRQTTVIPDKSAAVVTPGACTCSLYPIARQGGRHKCPESLRVKRDLYIKLHKHHSMLQGISKRKIPLYAHATMPSIPPLWGIVLPGHA